MQIEILDWPDDHLVVERLRVAGLPRLLVVDADVEPPDSSDPLQDWVRRDTDPSDVEARIAVLRRRAGEEQHRPVIDGSGVLHHRGRWVALTPVEARITSALLARFGAVVGRDALSRAGRSGELTTRNLLDVQMVRVRRRLASLGLQVRTVRSRGYLIQFASESAERVST